MLLLFANAKSPARRETLEADHPPRLAAKESLFACAAASFFAGTFDRARFMELF